VARAAESSRRDPAAVRILAVTKGYSIDAVRTAQALGLQDIGESRVQEAQSKRSALGGAALTWHMIGHLQRNKARAAASLFDVVHSVDSVALAAALARHHDGAREPLEVYVEVELTGRPGRSGVSPDATAALIDEVRTLRALALEGLMTIAPPGPPEEAAACFTRLRDLRDDIRDRTGLPLGGLSMGMSGDFEVAIAHGATIIRLGHALFGDPPGPGT
jgi:pyridoxal phosphate enzyme (YggS family)